jgi:hypothetical protein
MTDPESTPGLRFDRAVYADEKRTVAPCSSCRGSLGAAYWKWQDHMVCARCRDALERRFQTSQSGALFAKTLFLGGAAALGCGIGYALLVAVTKTQLALATIGIAVVIARVIRKASGGLGVSTRYRVAAVALTYLAATMGYLPWIWAAMQESSVSANASQTEAKHSSPDGAVAADSGSDRPATASPLELLHVLGWVLWTMLEMPFLEVTHAPFGALIVGFGLWQAWKLSRGPPLAIQGPFHLDAAPARPDSP